MKKLYIILTILVIFTMTSFVVSFSQTLTVRSEEVYSFYFNDSRAVDKMYTEYTANDMAREISGFMKHFHPETFEVLEDTGYDVESLFTDEEAYNMMCVKKVVDWAFMAAIVSFVLTVGIYFFMLKKGCKKHLRIAYKISIPLMLAGIGTQFWALRTEAGRAWAMEKLAMNVLPEESELAMILGPDFTSMAAGFYIGIALVIFAICTYAAYLLTKEHKIFADNKVY